MTCLQAFEGLFEKEGWVKTVDKSFEIGFNKIALYSNVLASGDPTHASRQFPNGKWTSKLGDNIDLSHELGELAGPAYGQVIGIFKKPTKATRKPK